MSTITISIHPSRVGWDSLDIWTNLDSFAFQSTHPVWDGTISVTVNTPEGYISIHPSRVGWDIKGERAKLYPRDFNPPIPCGMGHDEIGHYLELGEFQSTHPVWDGTQ